MQRPAAFARLGGLEEAGVPVVGPGSLMCRRQPRLPSALLALAEPRGHAPQMGRSPQVAACLGGLRLAQAI